MACAAPLRELPPIDHLEGFRPSGNCLYQRGLVATRCDRAIMPAWIYGGASPYRAWDSSD